MECQNKTIYNAIFLKVDYFRKICWPKLSALQIKVICYIVLVKNWSDHYLLYNGYSVA